MSIELCMILIFALVNSCNTDPIVKTRFGQIQGVTGNHDDLKYEAFLGIPFAEPPLGNLRFQMPVPFNKKWSTTYQALNFKDGCIQNPQSYFNFNISEDCLYLNVWRPEIEKGNNSELLPVFYLLHGSGYIMKSGALPQNQGDVLSATQKIIVVNSNYRLGALGFAYGSHDLMPGNIGIYDSLAVLRWIQDNIRSFGGDPNRVTLAGQSAGANMATIIATLPYEFKSQHLFSRLIMMSGVTVNNMVADDKSVALLKTRLMASKVNCLSKSDLIAPTKLSYEIIECLKNVDAYDLLRAQNEKDIIALGSNDICAFLPVYETELMPDLPMINHAKLIESSKHKPMIFGVEQDEVTRFMSLSNIFTLKDAYDFFKMRILLSIKDIKTHQIDFFYSFYFKNADPSNTYDIRSRCVKFLSDMWFHCTSLILSEFFSQKNPDIYFYLNGYVGETLAEHSGRLFGTVHGDDILFGLGDPIRQNNLYTSNDRRFSRSFLNLFGNFTKGLKFNDWPSIELKGNDYESLQIIKKLNLSSTNIVDHDQLICNKWAELFNYSISQFPISD